MSKKMTERFCCEMGGLIQNCSALDYLCLAWSYALAEDHIVLKHFLKRGTSLFPLFDLLIELVESREMDAETKAWLVDTFTKVKSLRIIRNTAAHHPLVADQVGDEPYLPKKRSFEPEHRIDFETIHAAHNDSARIMKDLAKKYEEVFGKVPTIP